MGFDTLYGLGVAEGVATDNNTGALITYAASASWNQVLVLWGYGLGGDTANDDRSYPATQDNLNYVTALYVGGVQRRFSTNAAPSIREWIKSTSWYRRGPADVSSELPRRVEPAPRL
jgi:hypothetical protein